MPKSGKHCHYVFKKPSAAEALESVYMRENVNHLNSIQRLIFWFRDLPFFKTAFLRSRLLYICCIWERINMLSKGVSFVEGGYIPQFKTEYVPLNL